MIVLSKYCPSTCALELSRKIDFWLKYKTESQKIWFPFLFPMQFFGRFPHLYVWNNNLSHHGILKLY